MYISFSFVFFKVKTYLRLGILFPFTKFDLGSLANRVNGTSLVSRLRWLSWNNQSVRKSSRASSCWLVNHTEFSSGLHCEMMCISCSMPIFSNVRSDLENILVSIKFRKSAILTRRFFSLARRPVDATLSSPRGCENGSSAGVSVVPRVWEWKCQQKVFWFKRSLPATCY